MDRLCNESEVRLNLPISTNIYYFYVVKKIQNPFIDFFLSVQCVPVI